MFAWWSSATPPGPVVHAQPGETPGLIPSLPPALLPPPAAIEKPTEVLAARALASAQSTVQTQLSLLEDQQYELFVQTFVEAQRATVTREIFDTCRTRIKQVPVRPDWEMAEQRVVEGRAEVAVSIFGKSLTTFTEVNGRWLADSVWCVPVGLP